MDGFEVHRPTSLNEDKWPELFNLAKVACEAAFIDGVDVDKYMGDFDRFLSSRLDPNSEVIRPDGNRGNNQEYHGSRLVTAHDDGRLVGWAYATHNVSGGGASNEPHDTSLNARVERGVKRLTLKRNYLQLVEAYVDPSFQKDHVATIMAERLTRLRHGGFPIMPMSTYIYPDIYKPGLSIERILRRSGFYQTGDPVNMTVGGLDNVSRLRMEAPTVMSARVKVFGRQR